MRWLLGRNPGSCDACGAELERGAAWCGGCGARADGTRPDSGDEPAVAAEAEADRDAAAAGPVRSRHRQLVVATLVLVLVAVAVAAQPRDGPAEPLLGELDQHAGLSATGPPPSGLRVAWAHEPEADSGNFLLYGPPQSIVVSDERVRLGNHVMDLPSGQLVRVSAGGPASSDGEWAVVEAGELVVLDTVTGAVRHRVDVSSGWEDRSLWGSHRARGVSLFAGERGSVLVGDDGAAIAELDGRMSTGLDRAVADPAAFPIRAVTAGHFDDQFTAPVRLVAAATGEVVLDLAEPGVRVVDVVGALAMVAETDARVDAFTSAAAVSDVRWTVRLLDAGSGRQRARLDVDSREPPRLLGTFDDGTPVIAAWSGDVYPVWVVAPDGSLSTVAEAQRPQGASSGYLGESSSLNAVVMTGDVLVMGTDTDEVVGLDRSGRRVWALDATGFSGLRADDGHVAVLGDDGDRIRLVRVADGEVVASRPTEPPQWAVASTPVAVLAGRLGLRTADPFAEHEEVLGATTWLDLQTGEPATLEEAFGPFLPDGATDSVDRSWLLHGTIATGVDEGQPQGAQEELARVTPVLTRYRPDGVLELLEPGGGVTRFPLPVPDDVDVGGREVQSFGRGIRGVRLLGATAERVAVWSEGFQHPEATAIHVLDRRTEDVMTLPGLWGVALVGDVLLATEADEVPGGETLVGIDAVTGERLWSGPPLDGLGWLDPLRVDDALVVDMGLARVTARSMGDGAEVWMHASDTELTGLAVLGPRHVAFATTTGEVVALDRTDGAVAWRSPVGTPIASITGAGDHVLVGTHDGLVVHLDGRGREVQRIVVGRSRVDAVAALGDTVVATVDQRVVGLRADGTGITRGDQVELP